MSVLRVYDPAECDAAGVPLDWERCRTCEGRGGGVLVTGHDPRDYSRRDARTCPTCDGHGSLKEAALAALMREPREAVAVRVAAADYDRTGAECHRRALGDAEARLRAVRWVREARCEDCGHPMSDGTWEAPQGPPGWGPPARGEREGDVAYLAAVKRWAGSGEPDPRWAWVHYSRCDEGCRHDDDHRREDRGRFRMIGGEHHVWQVGWQRPHEGVVVEASWRQVDVRTLGWQHDLRPEKLAVLCLRCYAAARTR